MKDEDASFLIICFVMLLTILTFHFAFQYTPVQQNQIEEEVFSTMAMLHSSKRVRNIYELELFTDDYRSHRVFLVYDQHTANMFEYNKVYDITYSKQHGIFKVESVVLNTEYGWIMSWVEYY